MYFGAEIIVLDEPTTALALKEVEKVLTFIEQIRADGKSCIIISHDLDSVFRVSDRFVLMDRGRIAGRYTRENIDMEGLMKAMLHHSNGGDR
jgi:simple sugar transport system ATP-binding protein